MAFVFILSRPAKLPRFDTDHLPDPSDWEGCVLYDYTDEKFKYSDGTNWITTQNELVSGLTIKTINGETLLGSGNIEITGGGGGSGNIDGGVPGSVYGGTTPIDGGVA